MNLDLIKRDSIEAKFHCEEHERTYETCQVATYSGEEDKVYTVFELECCKILCAVTDSETQKLRQELKPELDDLDSMEEAHAKIRDHMKNLLSKVEDKTDYWDRLVPILEGYRE